MKMISLIVSMLFCTSMNSQCIIDVYPTSDLEAYSCEFVKDSNIVILYPIPFKVTYIIELDSETYIHRVEIDRNIPDIEISVYLDGRVIYFPKMNDQSFCIEARVMYLFVTYREECSKVHLFLE